MQIRADPDPKHCFSPRVAGAGAGRSRGFWLEPEPKFSPGSGSYSYSYSTVLKIFSFYGTQGWALRSFAFGTQRSFAFF